MVLSPRDLVSGVRVCGGNRLWGLSPQEEGRESRPSSSSGPLAWVLLGGHILHFTEEDAKTQKDRRLPDPQIHIC